MSWWAPTTNFQEFPRLLTSFPSERYLQAEETQPHRSHCSSAEKNTTKVHPRFWRCLRSSCSGYGPWKSWYVLEFMPRGKLIQWYVYDMMKFFIHPMQEHEGYSKVWSIYIYIYETRFVHWWIQTVIACKCCIITPLCLGRRPTIDNLPQEVSESHHWNLRFIKARTTTQ